MKKIFILLSLQSSLSFAAGVIGGGPPALSGQESGAGSRGLSAGGTNGGTPPAFELGTVGGGGPPALLAESLSSLMGSGSSGGTPPALLIESLSGGSQGGGTPPARLYEVGGSMGGTPPAMILKDGGSIGGGGGLELAGVSIGGGSGTSQLLLDFDEFQDVVTDAIDDGRIALAGQQYILKAIDSLENTRFIFLLKSE